MLLLSLLAACTATDSADDTSGESPTIDFLSPADGAAVAVGDVAVSLVVDGFTLLAAAKHSEGAPEGHIAVTLDGAEVLVTGETQFTVTIDTAGAHTLGAELVYEDGDSLEPAVTAEVEIDAE